MLAGMVEEGGEGVRENVYRYAYPATMGTGLIMLASWAVAKAFGRWRKRVRDEVYLIGERLHNYGEARRKGKDVHAKDKGKGKEKEKVERPVLEEGRQGDAGLRGRGF